MRAIIAQAIRQINSVVRKTVSPPFLPHTKPQRHEDILGNGTRAR
jgi:hypothetical protein